MPKPKWLGDIEQFNIPNPAAGLNVDIQPPAGQVWLLIGLSATFTCSVAVANRQLYVHQRGGIYDMGLLISPVVEVAGGVSIVEMSCLYTGIPFSVLNRRMFPLGHFYYLNNTIYLRLVADNIQAADQWSAIWINYYRMLEE